MLELAGHFGDFFKAIAKAAEFLLRGGDAFGRLFHPALEGRGEEEDNQDKHSNAGQGDDGSADPGGDAYVFQPSHRSAEDHAEEKGEGNGGENFAGEE